MNADHPEFALFSILDHLENFRDKEGKFHFKLCYPELTWGNDEEPCNEWLQSSNPYTDSTIEDFEPVFLAFEKDGNQRNWGGLGLNSYDGKSIIDDSPSDLQWYSDIGALEEWTGKIPGPKHLRDSYKYSRISKVELYALRPSVEKAVLDLQCDAGTFKVASLIDETFVDKFSIECGQDGNWIGFEKCSPPLCEALEFDSDSVKETLWKGDHNQTTGTVTEGAISKLQCKEEGFSFSDEATTRLFYTCYRQKWFVEDNTLCPDLSKSCKKPIEVSCSMTGCQKPIDPYLERVSYEPNITV